MPNYMIPISEVCYKEFLNIKHQLKINTEVWSDSEILKLIFEKIDSNKEFVKDLQTIGKSSRGRSLPMKNFKTIRSENFEDLAKCPGCDHSICMLKHSLREMVRIEMHTHFDTFHNKAGYFQCNCGSTFDWMPAYLRHTNMCSEEVPKESTSVSESNSNSLLVKEESVEKSFTIQSTFSSEYESLSKYNKPNFEKIANNKEGFLNKNCSTEKSICQNLICNGCGISFQNSDAILSHVCGFSEVTNENTKQSPNIYKLENIPKETQLTNSNITYQTSCEKQQSIETASDAVNCGESSVVIKLMCQCRQVYTNYNEYRSHTIICKEKPVLENHKENRSNPEVSSDILKNILKNVLKDCKPNSDGKYNCPSCTKSFPTLISLKQHMQGKHLQNFKKCTKCGKLFSWSTSFKCHKKKCLSQ